MRLTRHAALAGVAVMMMIAASCGSDDDSGSSATTSPAATSPAATTPASTASTPAPTTPATSAETTATTEGGTETSGAVSASAVTVSIKTTSLGDILVDQDGKTLYLFQKDTAGQPSTCGEGCVANWPPLVSDGTPNAGEGIDAEDLSLIARSDGAMQVAFYGWPLYYFANDAAPGDTNGQGVGGIWWTVDAEGNAVGA